MLIVKASAVKPVMPAAKSAIFQLALLTLGSNPLAFVVLALFGLTSLWVAVIADVGMLLLVTANGLRPLRFEGGRAAA